MIRAMRKCVIMMAGRSPLDEIGGGHCSYVRAHAHAASAAGFEVHIYCMSDQHQGVHRQPYGVIHHIAANGIPVRQRHIGRLAEPLALGAARDREVWAHAVAVQSFGTWAYAGCRAIRHAGPQPRPRHIMSMYTVYREESLAQFQASRGTGPGTRARLLAEWLHVRMYASRREHAAYRQCDVVTVNYRSVEHLVLRMLGPHPRLRVVPYSPEAAFASGPPPARDRAPSGRPVRVLTLALQKPKKGIRVLLDAFSILRKEGIPFTGQIAGAGPMAESNRRTMRELGLARHVTFTGFVENTAPLWQWADIYVQPSLREESGSLALLEAMRAGLPVICSDVDGMAEDVRTGTDGLAVPPGHAGKLADAIRLLIRDDGRRALLASAAQARFMRLHAPDTFIHALRDLYEPN